MTNFQKEKLCCEYCKNFWTFNEDDLEYHQSAHEEALNFHCSACNVKFLDVSLLEAHHQTDMHKLKCMERRMQKSVITETTVEHISTPVEIHSSHQNDEEDLYEAEVVPPLDARSGEGNHISNWFPYSGVPMLMLQHWKRTEGRTLGQVAFTNLLRLIRKLVHNYGTQPNLFPRNYHQILECEKRVTLEDHKTIQLDSGGCIMMTNLTTTIQTMFQNPTIFTNIHFQYVEAENKGPLWTGTQWKISQEKCEELCPGSKIFPLLCYSDKTTVLRSRAGQSLHPIIAAPAGVPRDIWKKRAFKYTLAYASPEADWIEVMNVIVEKVNSLIFGKFFHDPQGHRHLLCVPILAWLGDHLELNDLTWLYPKACRRCQETSRGRVQRTLESGINQVSEMWELWNEPLQKQTAYEKSQQLQQHIGLSPLMKLAVFDLYQQTPASPGHSENLGRTKRHLLEHFKKLSTPALALLNDRLKTIARFPGLVLHSSSNSTSFTQLILKETCLTAEEYQSIRAVILFLLVGLNNDEKQYLWRLHVEYSAGYYKKEWSPYNREYWIFLREQFQDRFRKNYPDVNYPKGHDPDHDDELIDQFGSFLNLDEMIFENCHQTTKQQKNNGKEILSQFLVQETRSHQLDTLFPNHAAMYQEYMHVKKPNIWKLKGKPQKEDWTGVEFAWKQTLLERALGVEMQDSVAVFKKLHHQVLDCTIAADQIVLVDAKLEVPWVCVQEFFYITEDDKTEPWMLVALYSWKDASSPIDYDTLRASS